MTDKKFNWVEHDYNNDSINNLSRNITEFNTAMLYSKGIEVTYNQGPEGFQIGTLFPNQAPFTVNDINIVNKILNYNIYFKSNTEDRVNLPKEHYGTFDALVCLASGDKSQTTLDDIGLQGKQYIIDISPTAIHESIIHKNKSEHMQVDLFDAICVKDFLTKVEGTKGLFIVSNCFLYVISSLVYDTKKRYELQNDLLKVLAEDKIDWYVEIVTVDGKYYNCISAQELIDIGIDKKMEILPWMKKF